MEAGFKILLIGKSGVGKSCILGAFTTKNFDIELNPTVGVDFKVKETMIDNDKIKLGIWDTAGMERFRVVIPSLYRDVHGVILVYDVTDKSSLEDLYSWVNELLTYSNKKNFVGLVLGNKIDQRRIVSTEEGQEFAKRHRMMFLESSAKTREGIDYAFEELARKIYETPGLWEYDRDATSLNAAQPDPKSSCGCFYCGCNSIDIKPPTLIYQIDVYNELCDSVNTDLWGKPYKITKRKLRTVTTDPFLSNPGNLESVIIALFPSPVPQRSHRPSRRYQPEPLADSIQRGSALGTVVQRANMGRGTTNLKGQAQHGQSLEERNQSGYCISHSI